MRVDVGVCVCEVFRVSGVFSFNAVCSPFFQMTGLDIEKDEIIEMACIITDSDLNIVAEVRAGKRDADRPLGGTSVTLRESARHHFR